MNRRGFLGLLGAAASAALIGELPSSKTFFLPPAGGWRDADLRYDLAAYARKYGHAIAESLRYTKEVRRADVLNRSYVQVKDSIAHDGTYDGIALFNAPHPEGPEPFSALFEPDLSEASLETICREAIRGGKPMSFKPTHITFCKPGRGLWRV